MNENVEQQTQLRKREKQYHILTGLGWRGTGILFLGLITVIIGYAAVF